jgi:hypothetical protein
MVVLVMTAGLVRAAAHDAGGAWAYPLDDTYIHLELAWRLITDGTWGINPGQPASASSSPLWTLALAAGLAVAGHNSWVALVLGTASALGAVAAGAYALRDAPLNGASRLASLLSLTLLTPLPVMAALGMEHGLQVLLTCLVVGGAGALRAELDERPSTMALGALALLCATRTEGLFLAAAWAGVMLAHRRWRGAVLVAISGTAPVAAFAAFSVGLSSPPLPNGLLMKSGFLGGRPWSNLVHNIEEGAPVVLLVLVVWLLDATRRGRLWGTARAQVLALTCLLHLGLAGVGWYYRYEAWLVGWGVLGVAAAGADWWRRSPARRARVELALCLGFGAAVAVSAGSRAFDAHRYLPGRVVYIQDAKVQLARSLQEVVPTCVIALHDIGAMAWETDLRIVDTAGLGSNDVLRLSRSGQFTGATIGALTINDGATIGLGTWSWMEHDRPAGWRPAARFIWGLDAVRVNEPIVAYAIAPGTDQAALEWLRRAVEGMNGHGRVEVPAGDQWVPVD